jgi:hypothetical protein
MISRWPIALAALLLIAVGCSTPKSTDLVAAGKVKSEKLDTPELILSAPQLTQNEKIVQFKGEVHRKPSFDGSPTGHIHLDMFDAKGEWIDQIAVGWQPKEIPKTGDRSAIYVIQYYWSPPPGAVVRATIVDDDHLADISTSGGRVTGGGTSTGHGNATPQAGGTPRVGSTKTPGTPHQQTQPRTPGVPTGRSGSYGGKR